MFKTLDFFKAKLITNYQKLTSIVFLPDNAALPSFPEPYVQTTEDQASPSEHQSQETSPTAPSSSLDNMPRSKDDGHEKLREKAAKQLHGPSANPSMLGDPVSLKAETSDCNPVPEEGGAGPAQDSTLANNENGRRGYGGDREGTKIREKKAREATGKADANPSMLGDPVSLKNEGSEYGPGEGERNTRDSKL